MTLHLYSLSGSPFGWKVQLALEHKGLTYEMSYLSPEKGDLKMPWFSDLNPHGKLPVLVDGDLVLFESDAVVEYLEEAFPAFGTSLWPRDVRSRAKARRMAIEASNYSTRLFAKSSSPFRRPETPNPTLRSWPTPNRPSPRN